MQHIRYRGAVYQQTNTAEPTITDTVEPAMMVVDVLRKLDQWFATTLEQLFRDHTLLHADYDQAANWLRQLDEYLVAKHEERPGRFEARVSQQLEEVYSAEFSSDIVVYMTDGGYSRFILPDDPKKLLTITPHEHGIGSTKQVEAR